MPEPTPDNLKNWPSTYESDRAVGEVIIGEDAARRVIEASSSGDDTTLKELLSQPELIKTMLEQPHVIYAEFRKSNANGKREVSARRMSNVDRALVAATENGHAKIVSILLQFAKDQNMKDVPDEATTRTLYKDIISGGHADVLRAFATADPNFINFHLPHGATPLGDAAKRRSPNVVAALLELGADPKCLDNKGYRSLLAEAARTKGTRMLELFLDRGLEIPGSAALHAAASIGYLDNMQFLVERGADVNEALESWKGWTPMHFAAWKGSFDAMKWLEEHGADPNLKDKEGKTPAEIPVWVSSLSTK